jgi:uncharacterized ubiquitin-like protein YukD
MAVDPFTGQNQKTVRVRVQVVDMKSFTLDLEVPTYLPAKDITQRVARDAGLSAFWDNGRRRLYWMRARGRLMQDDENLEQLGVIDGELVYLLPEPPAGAGVDEQIPEYPENKGYAGKGTLTIIGSLFGMMAWAVGWGAALVEDRNLYTVMLPGLGLGFLIISLARHLWGGQGSSPRILLTGLTLYLLIVVMVFLPAAFTGSSVVEVYVQSLAGVIMGLIGLMIGWLAWWGAVEPLPLTSQKVTAVEAAVVTVPCGICGLGVTPEVRADCSFGCGKTFHSGCLNARLAVYRGDPRFCGVCNARVR